MGEAPLHKRRTKNIHPSYLQHRVLAASICISIHFILADRTARIWGKTEFIHWLGWVGLLPT
jgi:hypothetical protein